MNKVAAKPPLGQKVKPLKAPKDYLARVRELPCCICEAFGYPQISETQAHHPICGRYSQRKAPDIMAIPLCEGHHQGFLDLSKVAIHKDKDRWVKMYDPDTDYVLPTQDKLGV